MQTQIISKELNIANHNNKLATECFIVIERSPGRDRIPSRSEVESRLYSAKHNDDLIFVKIIDMLFVPFGRLTDHLTYWGNGLNATEYQIEFLKKHPATNADTEMVVYYYQRVREEPVDPMGKVSHHPAYISQEMATKKI